MNRKHGARNSFCLNTTFTILISLGLLLVQQAQAQYVLYRANLHSHTAYSDGGYGLPLIMGYRASPFSAYQHGQQNSLNVMSVSDHAEETSITEWNQALVDSFDATNTNGTPFVGLRGFEWTATQLDSPIAGLNGAICLGWLTLTGFLGLANDQMIGDGHINVFGSLNRVGAYYNANDPMIQIEPENVRDSLDSFYDWLNDNSMNTSDGKQLVAQFNHPSGYDNSTHFHNFIMPDGDRGRNLRDIFALIELGSEVEFSISNVHHYEGGMGPPSNPYDPNSSNEYWFRQALDSGWHVAPTNNEDNHFGGYGETNRYTGIYAPDISNLSREAARSTILDALRARRVFASEDMNSDVLLLARVGSETKKHWMGEAFQMPGDSSLTLSIITSDLPENDDDYISSVEVVTPHGSIPVRLTWQFPDSQKAALVSEQVTLSARELNQLQQTLLGETYFYVKVTQKDGDLVYSAPIWITRSLPAPTGLVATTNYTGVGYYIQLSWKPVVGASQYYIYRSTSPGGEGQLIYSSTSGSSLIDYGLDLNTTYYYQVTAVNSNGESPRSAEVSATAGATPLPGPFLRGKVANNTCGLIWTAVNGATSYNVYRGDVGLLRLGVTGTVFIDYSLNNGQTYSYYVCAVNKDGQGSSSNTIQLTPGVSTLPAPTGLVATTNYTGVGYYIQLSWKPVVGASQYYIYRSTSPGGEGQLIYSSTSGSSLIDYGLDLNTTYYYQVTAVNSNGESPRSAEVSATAGATPLPGPFLRGKVANNTCGLIWTAVNGATSYNVYRNGSLFTAGVRGTNFVDGTVTNGQTYSYYVCAVNKDGQGSSSNTIDLTPGG